MSCKRFPRLHIRREVLLRNAGFTIVPSALVLLPSIVDAARNARPSVLKICAAAIGYWTLSTYGLLTEIGLYANLGAALIPVAIAIFA